MAERQCVSVSNLNAPTCPVGSNGLTCSGNSRGVSGCTLVVVVVIELCVVRSLVERNMSSYVMRV